MCKLHMCSQQLNQEKKNGHVNTKAQQARLQLTLSLHWPLMNGASFYPYEVEPHSSDPSTDAHSKKQKVVR